MKPLFADAFYFVARLNPRDQHHDQVSQFVELFEGDILTTDWILMEVADALASSKIHSRIRDFMLDLRDNSSCEIVESSRDLLDRALALYDRHSDKGWSLTDCTSFIVMRDRGITEALTGDKHFDQAGFIPLFK